MPEQEVNDERIWARVPSHLNAKIEAKAAAARLSKSDWLRTVIVNALEGKGLDETISMHTEHVVGELSHRIDQLEKWIYYENHAILHHIKVVHSGVVHARAAAVAAALSTGFIKDSEAELERAALKMVGEAEFEQEFNANLPALRDHRARACEKSRDLPRSPRSSQANGAGAEA